MPATSPGLYATPEYLLLHLSRGSRRREPARRAGDPHLLLEECAMEMRRAARY